MQNVQTDFKFIKYILHKKWTIIFENEIIVILRYIAIRLDLDFARTYFYSIDNFRM